MIDTILLVAAVLLFLLSAYGYDNPPRRPVLLPLGLACWALTLLL